MIRKQVGILIILVILSFILILTINQNNNFVNYDIKRNISCFSQKIILKQHLLKAIRYTRSSAVKQELLQALILITNDINEDRSEIEFNRIQRKEQIGELQDVCLEEFRGVVDHPLYNFGQMEIKCKKKAFEDVLTFVITVDDCHEISPLVKGIQNIYNKSQIIVNVLSDGLCNPNMFAHTTIVRQSKDIRDWLYIFRKINTEYILFAPNIYHFDNQSKIERLVQMVSYTDIKIAAGGVRLEDGKFSTGCYQTAMKMYTLKLVEGYDMSFNSCLYCDYSPAPFVTRKSFLIEQLKQIKSFEKDTFLLEFFIDLKISKYGQILVCPDVMFHTKPYDLSTIRKDTWLPFVSKFELNRIILPGGRDRQFTCSESNMLCYKQKGLMVPLCCLKELSNSLKFMNKLLKDQNVTFEVLEGTVMGGLKYNNILFWERDADTNFRVHMIDKLEEKLDEIGKQGYLMKLDYECPFKRDHEKCRHAGWHGSIYYAFRTPNWRTEMYGVTYILSDFRGKLKNPTKINIDGEWYITYTNPALYGRNIYGGDIFQHLEHHSVLGISHTEYSKLSIGSYAQCPRPGFHGCLDNFVGEGSLQFLDLHI